MPRDYKTSDEIIAEKEAQMTQNRTERIEHTAMNRQRGLMVIMEDVHNVHNLGAIARSCDAFGVQQVAFTMQNDELFNPAYETRLTSTAVSKWLSYRIFRDGSDKALTTLKQEGWHIMATVMSKRAVPVYDIDVPQYEKLAILVGNEHAGLSDVAIEAADSHITIPMMGMARSFNVSVATAIILSEVTRQRNASDIEFRLPPYEAEALRREFIRRSGKQWPNPEI